MTTLLTPEDAGPSSRPVSVSAQGSPPHTTAPRKQYRASHSVTTSSQNHEEQPSIPDVYSHPAAVAYSAAHPRRSIPKFGPYLLLQTLGEGEFGKVKLGLHSQWGEEVAVKLIRRGNVDSKLRMSKVEREIEVLRTLKHPNIVRLYDVIETDKYIGIILEYASGGELFDHILAHRYLKERDAGRLFAQLISGVWYIHQKKIVHRDLKLENLLLDRNRNVIITDFGFANRFEHRSDDLMQTSCGSPCYAAPELVISEGLYVGSAVDIWSCGVILYAMLAGYLPFDDDPANPDGDNINLLYKYIVNTPLSFPDYISESARDILSIMLVPDPKRRANLTAIMRHPWLAEFAGEMPVQEGLSMEEGGRAFGRSVEELERAAMEQHQQKRLAYQRQMRAAAASSKPSKASHPPVSQSAHLSMQVASPSSVPRSHSHHVDVYSTPAVGDSRSRSSQPEYLYETSNTASPVDQSMASSIYPAASPATKKGHSSAAVIPSSGASGIGMDIDDPFAGPNSKNTRDKYDGDQRTRRDASADASAPAAKSKETTPAPEKRGSAVRHTIQVEYDSGPAPTTPQQKRRERTTSQGAAQSEKKRKPSSTTPEPPRTSPPATLKQTPQAYEPTRPQTPPPTTSEVQHQKQKTASSPERKQSTPTATPVPIIINPASPPSTPSASANTALSSAHRTGQSQGSTGSKTSKHRAGGSISGGLGLGKIFGNGPSPADSRVPSESSTGTKDKENIQSGESTRSASLQPPSSVYSGSSGAGELLANPEKVDAQTKQEPSSTKKSRRNTLTVMVEPFSFGRSSKSKTKGRGASVTVDPPTPSVASKGVEPPKSAIVAPLNKPSENIGADVPDQELGVTRPSAADKASSSKSAKVMQWFRSKSKGQEVLVNGDEKLPSASPADISPPSESTAAPAVPSKAYASKTMGSSRPSHEPNMFSRIRNSVTVGSSLSPASPNNQSTSASSPEKRMRIHVGAVDQTTVTAGKPQVVMRHVKEVLQGMGVEVQIESEFKYRCVRSKRRRIEGGSVAGGEGVAAFNVMGSAASNGVDKRGLPVPSFHGTGGMLRGLLMRRQSSQVSGSSQPSLPIDDDQQASPISPNGASAANSTIGRGSVLTSEPTPLTPTLYGDASHDAGDEVRFSVELTKIDRLEGTYSVDIRRLKGNLRSYKFLYDSVRDRADLQRVR